MAKQQTGGRDAEQRFAGLTDLPENEFRTFRTTKPRDVLNGAEWVGSHEGRYHIDFTFLSQEGSHDAE